MNQHRRTISHIDAVKITFFAAKTITVLNAQYGKENGFIYFILLYILLLNSSRIEVCRRPNKWAVGGRRQIGSQLPRASNNRQRTFSIKSHTPGKNIKNSVSHKCVLENEYGNIQNEARK